MIDEYSDRWALITGASSGIGLEFAHRLAARGMHLGTDGTSSGAAGRAGCRPADPPWYQNGSRRTGPFEPEAPRKLYDEINARGVQIELLINNAGFSVVSDIASTDRERVMQMVQLNMGALTDLTYLYLPEMMERGHGGIINIASVAAFQPVAYMSAYAASKSYVLHFTEGLWAEARDKGVTVTALCPGTTQTEFFDVAGVGRLAEEASLSDRRSGGQDRPQSPGKETPVYGFRLGQLPALSAGPHRDPAARWWSNR